MASVRTIEDLYRFEGEGKAELVGGVLIEFPLQGDRTNRAAGAVHVRLRMFEALAAAGRAYTGGAVFLVRLPDRQSFSPDVAFYVGLASVAAFSRVPPSSPSNRSEGDYGKRAETRIAAKRADYFAAGTQVIWDVDVRREGLIRVFRASDPAKSYVYRRGDTADAEPALPGFRVQVDEIFE